MNSDLRIAHIATLSRRLRRSIWIILGLVSLSILVMMLSGYGAARLHVGGAQLAWHDLPPMARLAVAVCLLPIAGLAIGLLFLADRLLALYERGKIFGGENARIIRRSGQLIVALAIANSLLGPVAVWLVSRTGVPVDSIAFTPEIGLFLVGLGIIVVGHVMNLGAELAEDSSLTI